MLSREIIGWNVPAGAANDIALSQTPGAAGALTLNGSLVTAGVALLQPPMIAGGLLPYAVSGADALKYPAQRRIRITCAGADAARIFTVKGHQAPLSGGDVAPPVTITMAGTNAGTTDSPIDWADITEVDVDAATAGAVTIGTSPNVAGIPWQQPESMMENAWFGIGFGVFLASGAATWHVEHCFNHLRPVAGYAVAPDVFLHSSLGTDQTATKDGNYAFPISGFRIVTTVGTGKLNIHWIQAGVVGGSAF